MTLEQDTTYGNTKELNRRDTLYLSDEVPTTVGSDSMGTITAQKLENNTAKNKTRKKQQFLSNPSVRRWYENLARKSLNTANAYQRRLRLFCESHQMSPMELAEIGMKDSKAVFFCDSVLFCNCYLALFLRQFFSHIRPHICADLISNCKRVYRIYCFHHLQIYFLISILCSYRYKF